MKKFYSAEEKAEVAKYLSAMGYDKDDIKTMLSDEIFYAFKRQIDLYKKVIKSQGIDDPLDFCQKSAAENTMAFNGGIDDFLDDLFGDSGRSGR